MSECPHWRSVPDDQKYHVPLGSGIDCCLACYCAISPPDDLSVFTMLNRAFSEQRMLACHAAAWFLAEKDAEIADLRDTIEMLEADEEVV